jgi:hypothetical protein
VRIEPARLDVVARIAENMREWDRREIYATRWDESPLALAADCLRVSGLAWTADDIVAIGAMPAWPGVWSVWMFATPEFPRIGLPLTRWAKREMIPAVARAGAHRAQCQSMAGHTEAHRWLETLGARIEGGPLVGYGRCREDFYTFVWSN